MKRLSVGVSASLMLSNRAQLIQCQRDGGRHKKVFFVDFNTSLGDINTDSMIKFVSSHGHIYNIQSIYQ